MVQTVGERLNFNFFLFYPYYFLNAALGPSVHLRCTRHWGSFRPESMDFFFFHAIFFFFFPRFGKPRRWYQFFFLDKLPIKKSIEASVFRLKSGQSQAYLLGLLAKIKCSICSYQLNLWYLLHGTWPLCVSLNKDTVLSNQHAVAAIPIGYLVRLCLYIEIENHAVHSQPVLKKLVCDNSTPFHEWCG